MTGPGIGAAVAGLIPPAAAGGGEAKALNSGAASAVAGQDSSYAPGAPRPSILNPITTRSGSMCTGARTDDQPPPKEAP